MAFIIKTVPYVGITCLQLNDSHHGNCLSENLIQELNQYLAALANDVSVKCLIITGTDKFFSVGADLKALQHITAEAFHEHDFIEPWQELARFPLPVIAAVSGYVYGGGFEIALMADIIIAHPETKFSFPEISLGLLPGGGGTQRLTQLVGKNKAMELCLTGHVLHAIEAQNLGIVNAVTTNIMQQALAVAQQIISSERQALVNTKKAILAASDISSGLKTERALFADLLSIPSYQDRIKQFLDRKRG